MASAAEAKPALDRTTEQDVERRGSVAKTEKGKWERLWPVIACGAGLFSDGYLNNVRPDPCDKKKRENPQRNNTPAQSIIRAWTGFEIRDC
jgi:hypothetical protein